MYIRSWLCNLFSDSFFERERNESVENLGQEQKWSFQSLQESSGLSSLALFKWIDVQVTW